MGLSYAPGWPGIPPRWTSSSKSGVGTALSPNSRVWFTLSHGILNEIYYPRVDRACTRDCGLIVTNGRDFFSEEKRHADSQVSYPSTGVPAYHLVNTCLQGCYRIEKDVIGDPRRDTVLQRTRFVPLQGALTDFHLHALLSPHLGNHGSGNTAWLGDYKGVPMLFAQRDGDALALTCSAPWLRRSAGFVGVSDGWQDLSRHYRMEWAYDRAENGNVGLTAEIDLASCGGEFVLAIGFGQNPAEAGHRALASLQYGFEPAWERYTQDWQDWQRGLHAWQPPAEASTNGPDLYRISAAMLRTHEAKRFPGGLIASLSIPWGFAKGDEDLGGYHLVWPRDLVEAAGGLLAVGAHRDARRVLRYLCATQEADGHWAQNTWLDGTPNWTGLQLDETAFPILLADLLRREAPAEPPEPQDFWPSVRRAAAYLVCNGPVTQQDRWEEDPGYSPFTLAVTIAALLAAADMADANQETAIATYLRETADAWNDAIERWTYVSDTDLSRRIGVQGYYVRIAPPETADASSPLLGFVPVKNRPPSQDSEAAVELLSPDALALVRFGLRSACDPRILDTVKAIDELLRVETPHGPAWHRYNDDGYGEHENGDAFDGTGIGRAWPLLAGERGHYELAAGRPAVAAQLLQAMSCFSNPGGLLPEQIWDSPDIPERELFFGHPSGSAMPLVWAHAEYVKLCRSLRDGRVFDTPPQTVQRYQVEKKQGQHTIWRFSHKCRQMPAGQMLRIETPAPATVHWSANRWQTVRDSLTRDTGLGIHLVDLPTQALGPGNTINFTFYWPERQQWEEADFSVSVLAETASSLRTAASPTE